MQLERHPIKRSFSQNSLPIPAKVPRVVDPSGLPSPFSAARHSPGMAAQPRQPHRLAESSSGSQIRPFSNSPAQHGKGHSKRGGKSRAPPRSTPLLDGPYHTERFIEQEYSRVTLKELHKKSPKGPLHDFYSIVKKKLPEYETISGNIMDGNHRVPIWRSLVRLDITPPVFGIGDHTEKKQSVHLAALSALYQLQALGVLENPKKLQPPRPDVTSKTLSDGSTVDYEKARSFMDYYCRKFNFGKPEIDFARSGDSWDATMTVGGRRIGLGSDKSKKGAQKVCYMDVAQYLEQCDPQLWKDYLDAARTGADLGMAPQVSFQCSNPLSNDIADLCDDIRKTSLYRNRPSSQLTNSSKNVEGDTSQIPTRPRRTVPQASLAVKSERLADLRKEYLRDSRTKGMRETRQTLPVYTQTTEILSCVSRNDVTIVMAATGSGKTTQIPQMILDDYTDRGEGAKCNIICTQPRRLAALSVANRVAKERGEPLGKSIGYQVRFEATLPEPNGSITFCTIGVFLRRLQSAMVDNRPGGGNMGLDEVTHIIVDEVHERDVDTDLLLVVLKHIMALKKARNQPLKIILMSATIDPTLFQEYFADQTGKPATVVNIPGRSYPVEKHFMDTFVSRVLAKYPSLARQEEVVQYISKELDNGTVANLGLAQPRTEATRKDDDLPYPLIAATTVHALSTSSDGHVLVFLPGWEEIVATEKALLNPLESWGINLGDRSKYAIHLLHSSIPLAEQQAIFEPPPPGVRRIILATNIAETSVTIPDVVCVVDTAKIKEQRYDPDRHMSSLVSSWVGKSNLNQRAGRAGRHRSGEYFGLLGKTHAESLHTHQTVEMKRTDLTNVVMHVKALNFPGMTVEEVLSAAIEPPDPNRVVAAMKDLKMVGALDEHKNLTALGRLLLQLPVEVQVGRLVLYGCFFRCLDSSLTLAAILTNRDPFLSPMHVRQEAAQRKNSWSLDEFRSDALTTLRAFNAWDKMQSRRDFIAANRFCMDNFLSKPTLLLIQKIKTHLLQAVYRAGVIEISAGGQIGNMRDFSGNIVVPPELNVNNDSLPLLAALTAIACQPKFAIRTDRTYRTPNDKNAAIHPSSVNHRKWEVAQSKEGGPIISKQLYAFADKRRNDSVGSSMTYLLTTTRLDPLTYILFGAYNVDVVQRGLVCDDWLPIIGDVDTLDDIQRLKTYMEGCMSRVFEGIVMGRRSTSRNLPIMAREADRDADLDVELDDLNGNYSLSREEIGDLDFLTREIVRILDHFSEEFIAGQSRQTSRAGTPISSPFSGSSRLPNEGVPSGYATPRYYHSRPSTPSRLRKF